MADRWGAIEAIGTAGGALVSALVLAVAVYQLRLLRRQVGDAAKGVEAASRSAEAAVGATVEASKARADANAPRLVVHVSDPTWPPLLDRTRSGMPFATDLRLLDPHSLRQAQPVESGTVFTFDRDRPLFLWFKMSGVVENEGSGSARVRLDGEAEFDGHRFGAEVIVRPGDRKTFQWGVGLSLEDWADQHEHYRRGRNSLTVTSMDYQEHGVIDHVYVEMGGRALEPQPDVTSGWRVASPESFGVTVYPTRRTYRWEWPDRRRPTPWDE